jgi:tetratricopeptide (TPR) repeat protein
MNGKTISKDEYTAANLATESLTNLDAGKLDVARIKAEQAKAIAPNFYLAVGVLGICYSRLGRSDEAIANLRQALVLKPNDPDMLWNLYGTLGTTGKNKDALAILRQFLAKYPKDPRALDGKALVSFFENQIRMNNTVTVHSNEDYFAEATARNTIRWGDKDIPIKIFIASGADVPGYQKAFGRVLQESLTVWEEASEGKIKFEQVTAPDQAKITFKWSNNPKTISDPTEGGEARLRSCGNALLSARIVVLTTNFSPCKFLTAPAVKFVCIHELGHALGIVGHSQSPKDIMFSVLPLNFEQLKLSARDGKTLHKLYSTAIVAAPYDSPTRVELVALDDIAKANDVASIIKEATAAIAAKSYNKAVEVLKAGQAKYPDSGPIKSNLAAAINNTGLTALDAQQYDKALELFQQALTLNPQSKTVRGNIANVHLDCGLSFLRVEKFAEAENSLKLAVEEFEVCGNKVMLARAANDYAIVVKKLGKDDEAKAIQEKYSVAGIEPVSQP